MIRRVVDFALNNRLLVLAFALLLFAGGIVAFRDLPIEAYPDVADNYVEVITQWPGISAEQIEQQVTIPLEVVMNGIPHVVHLRSFSLFGLSDLKLIFDDESDNDWNRERVLERLSQVTLPPNVVPQMGTDWSPVGQIYFFTLRSTNPAYDPMELKSIEDWVIEKNFKAVPDVVDVASFGGPTREYQVRVDPNKLVSYGLSLAQIEQQLTNNNVNAGGSFIQEGLQQINVRSVGLVDRSQDIEQTVILAKNGTPLRVRDIAVVAQGPKIRLGQFAKAIHREDGKIIDNDDVVSGIVLLRKDAAADTALSGIHKKVEELNDHILPPGVKVVPFIDRSDLVHFTSHTVLHNLLEGMILVSIVLLIFLGNVRGALIVAATIPFSLLFASICLDLRHIPANLLSLGALDFGMVVDGAVVMIENIVRHLSLKNGTKTPNERISDASHEVQRPVFYAIAIIITAYLPIFTLQRVEGRLFHPMAWTVAFALLGALLFSIVIAPVLASFAFRKGAQEWRNPAMAFSIKYYRLAVRWAIRRRALTVGAGVLGLFIALYLAFSGIIGSEFLPHLDEGALWVRGTLAPSTGPDEGIRVSNQARIILCSFPEVPQCTSQTGRPDDGTDTTSFFNTEYFVDLKPKEEWRPVFHENKDELIAAMNRELNKIPGVVWGFSQPIEDNMEEAVSGVKGELATKVYGDDLKTLEEKSDQIARIMGTCQGNRGSGSFSRAGPAQPERDREPRCSGPLPDQRRGCAGCDSDCRGRQRADTGAQGRGAIRPRTALPPTIPGYKGRDREHSPAGAFRGARVAGPTQQHRRDGWRLRNLSRRQSTLCCHQVQRPRSRSGRRRGRGDEEGQRTGQTAARISHRLGGRIRKSEKSGRAIADRSAHHNPAYLHHPLHHVQIVQVGVADPGERCHGSNRRSSRPTDYRHKLQRFFRRWFPGAVRRIRADRSHHARIHQSASRTTIFDRRCGG